MSHKSFKDYKLIHPKIAAINADEYNINKCMKNIKEASSEYGKYNIMCHDLRDNDIETLIRVGYNVKSVEQTNYNFSKTYKISWIKYSR